MRALGAAAAALAAALLSQAGGPQARRPARGRPDAGFARTRDGAVLLGTDPPGTLKPVRDAADGGVAPIRDAGLTDDLRREVRQLRARVDALEQERARWQEQQQKLDQLDQDLQAIRTQLAEAESRRQQEEQQQASLRQGVEAGVSALQQADTILAGGSSAVEAQLAQAQASLPPQAQANVEAARAALVNRDLSAARTYLKAAIAQAQQGR